MKDHVIRVAWFGTPSDNLQNKLLSDNVEILDVFHEPQFCQWESVLADPNLDAIVFSATQSTSENQNVLRTLMQNQIPVAVVNPDADSLFAYELEMIRLDAGSRLTAILPKGCEHKLEATAVRGQARLSDPSLSRIYHHLTHDLLYLENTLGLPKYVFAMGARLHEDARNLAINVEFTNGCLLNWTAGAPRQNSQFEQDNILIDFDHDDFSTSNVKLALENLVGNENNDDTWVRY